MESLDYHRKVSGGVEPVNINFLISKRIKELYNVATGNIRTEEHEKELEEVDVVFTKQEVENKDNKKGRGDKKYARKR